MGDGWGTFRAETGDVSLEDDAIRIHRSPRRLLQGVGLRWRHGDRRQRAKVVAGLLFAVGLLAFWVLSMGDGTAELFSDWAIGGLVITHGWILQTIVRTGLKSRDRRIPLEAVEDVTVDPEDRELTITHEAGRRLDLTTWGNDTTEVSLTLPTDGDVRAAKTTLRTRGVTDDIDLAEPEETETVYRFDSKGGIAFCERCGSQVSPSDRSCPACDYALRVERPVSTDSGDRGAPDMGNEHGSRSVIRRDREPVTE